MFRRRFLLFFSLVLFIQFSNAQTKDSLHKIIELPHQDTIVKPPADTILRITNLNPYFSMHVDSSINYKLQINKNPNNYYWFLKNPPAGLTIDKDHGIIRVKSNKSLFLAGRVKYDHDYTVNIGVQSLLDPKDKVDTSFIITFYNTDVILPRVKPSVVSPVYIDEGSTLNFNVLCENGNFPITGILFSSSASISNFKMPKKCEDVFEWTPPYDFVHDKDSGKVKIVTLNFVGTTQFNFNDTARIRVIVKDALNYDIANQEYDSLLNGKKGINRWIKDLKYTFFQLDKRVRKTKNTRSTFDITSATSTVSGTIISATDKNSSAGKIIPSAGVLIIPIKEAAAPVKTVEQNQANLVRSTIKRLEYVMFDNQITSKKDPTILTKIETLKKELRQSQVQLAEVPTEGASNKSDAELDKYFNSPRVQKKYRTKQ